MKTVVSALGLVLLAGTASATRVDLTTAPSSGSLDGSTGGIANFVWVDNQTTGTGVIEPFVRLQQNGTEQGYNTSGSLANQPDVKAGTWTHDLKLGAVPIVNGYYQFLLDINQNKGGDGELLSLEDVHVYTSDNGGATTGDHTQLGDLKWAMAAGDDVKLNFVLNPGSGAGDMFMYIPVADLGNDPNKFVYLYSHFGTSFATNDGFEEWAVFGPNTAVPLPTAAGMGILGLAGAAFARRRWNRSV